MRWDSDQGRSFIADLRGQFGQSWPSILYGIGSWFGPGVDGPSPLFLIDQNEITVIPFDLAPLATVEEPTQEFSEPGGVRVAVRPALLRRVRYRLVAGRPRLMSTEAREILGGWLGSAVVIPTVQPDPLVDPSSLTFDRVINQTGTVGVPVERTAGDGRSIDGFLMAGHAAGGLESTIVEGHRFRLDLRPRKVLGRVSLHRDPAVSMGYLGPNQGIDIAVVDLDQTQRPGRPVSHSVAQLDFSPPEPIPVRVHGGFGARRRSGMVVASLVKAGPPNRQWTDVWILAPSGRAWRRGDSGAAVVTESSKQLVGMLVGGGRQGPTLGAKFHYVQDYDSVERALLGGAGVRLR